MFIATARNLEGRRQASRFGFAAGTVHGFNEVMLLTFHEGLDWDRKIQFFELFAGKGRVSRTMKLSQIIAHAVS